MKKPAIALITFLFASSLQAAVVYWQGNTWTGLASDTKPTAAEGSRFVEVDTQKSYVRNSGQWKLVADGVLLDYLRQTEVERLCSGLVSGGTITANAQPSPYFSVAAGTGYIVNHAGTVGKRVSWGQQSNIQIITTESNYVYVDINGIVQVSTTKPDMGVAVYLGHVQVPLGMTKISEVMNIPEWAGHFTGRVNDWMAQIAGGMITGSGNKMLVSERPTPNELELNFADGVAYIRLSTVNFAQTYTFKKMYDSADIGRTTDSTNLNHVDTTRYNDPTLPSASALVTMTDGWWKKDFVFRVPSGNAIVFYGQAQYESEDLAKSGPLPNIPPSVLEDSIPLAVIVSRKGDTDLQGRIYDIRPYMPRLMYGTTAASGFIVDHGTTLGLTDDDHPQYLTTGRADLLYAALASGVTGGNSHDHNGGDGAQIAYSSLSGLPTQAQTIACTGSDKVRAYDASTGTFTCATDQTSAGGGYATIQEEGGGLTQRTTLNFVGSGITCADDTTRTTCTLSAGGTGDVVGPASAASGNFSSFSGTTGKLIADSTYSAASFAAAAHTSATTGVHGVGASTVESTSGSQGKVDTHAALTTTHGASGAILGRTTADGLYGPIGAKYILQQADSTLTGEQALGALGTGILKNTTTTGVLSIAGGADLPTMTATVGGAVPTPPNNTTTFLRGDGTFAAPASGGAPTTVPYWTGASDAGLSAEKDLSALGTALVINTAGTPSAYAGGSCTNQFPRSLSAVGALTCAGVGVADFTANQGTTTQVLHGNAAGQPSWGAIATADLPTVTVAKGGSGLTTVASDQILIATATDTFTATTVPDCSNASTSKMLYTAATHSLSCGVDQTSGGGQLSTKLLAADAANSTITPAKVTGLDKTAVQPGTYSFKYVIRYQTAIATTGIRFDVNFSGTVTSFVWNEWWVDTAATASAATPDQDEIIAASAVPGAFASRAKGTAGRGTTLSVDTANADMLIIIEGLMVVTVAGDLQLYSGSEIASSAATVKAGSALILTQIL
jgi:hypothetical protein